MKSWLLLVLVALMPITAQTHQQSVLRIGQIKIDGQKALPPDQIINACAVKPRATINETVLDKLPDKIQKLYVSRGYLRAKATVRKEIKQGVVDLYISIDEGSVYLVRRLEFIGNETTSDVLVRRKAHFNEGEPFREELVEETLQSFNKWGRFEKLTREDIETHIDDQEHIVDVLIKLKEKRRR